MGGVAIAEEGDARARLVSVAAVTVEETGRRVDGRTAGRLAEADFADARVGLVPAPIRALGGGASAGAGGGNDADPETDGALGALSRVGGLARAKAALEEALGAPLFAALAKDHDETDARLKGFKQLGSVVDAVPVARPTSALLAPAAAGRAPEVAAANEEGGGDCDVQPSGAWNATAMCCQAMERCSEECRAARA